MIKKNIKRNIVLLVIIIFFVSTITHIVSGNIIISTVQKSIIDIQNRVEILYVGGSGPDNYTNIMGAVNDASDGDTVFVYSGIYYEHVVIGITISLIGENKETTIIDGGLSKNCIDITANSVVIDGFTIRKGLNGVNVIQASDQKINNNIIRNNWGGINLFQVTDSEFSNNSIMDSFFEGINPIQSSNNIFSGNKIFWNIYGISFTSSNNNFIFENEIKGNTRGIEMVDQSNNNKIYHNNFYSNEEDNAYDDFSNIWDDGFPSGGNYWDDYTGKDNDGDGIGDTPYTIPSNGGNNEDRYPLMNPYIPQQPPNTPKINGPSSGIPGQEYMYSLTNTVDPEDDLIYAFLNWGDGETSGWLGPYNSGDEIIEYHTWDANGKYEIKAKLKDEHGKESGWAILEVTMPRNKVVIKPLQLLLQSYQNLFQLIQKLLQ